MGDTGSRRGGAVLAAMMVLMVQPAWAGSPLKGADVKLGKTTGAANRQGAGGASATPSPAPKPGPSPAPKPGLVGAAKVKSHSNTNNN